jgi:hypothetical protein
MDPIEAAMSQYKTQLGTTPFCVVFTPARSKGAFNYPAKIEGPDSINYAILADFPSALILNIG